MSSAGPDATAVDTVDARFANYVDAPTSVAQTVWLGARAAVLGLVLAVVVVGFLRPETMLDLVWGVMVPVLPAVWMLAPGLWRNTCPLATMNQLPRVLGFSRARTAPGWYQKAAYSIAVVAFVALVLTRKVVFNTSGAATSLLIASALGLAFVGGVVLKGKSGWCSAICPLLPIQRLYGQAPVGRIANAHCSSCVGCAKNCFDFNPGVAYLADMYDADPQFVDQRTVFAGAFPGLVIAFFTLGSADEIGVAQMYGQSLLWIMGGIAAFRLAHTYLPRRANTFPPLFGALGFALFYWYSFPRIAAASERLLGGDLSPMVWPGRGLAIAVALNFAFRAFRSEQAYLSQTAVSIVPKANVPAAALSSGAGGRPSVKFVESGETVEAPGEPSILEVAEAAGMSIAAGCRMGVCGADPVSIVSGSGGLTPALPSEVSTLSRLGLGPPNRMACVARVIGECAVALKPDLNSVPEPEEQTFEPDRSVERVIVVGNGIAGVTAADYVRRSHNECSIDVIGREAYHLYNRMGISKLIYQPQGVASLNLLDDEWYDRNKVTSWLNTTVRWLDLEGKRVELGTGEFLPYDRLILAMGSSARMPSIEGFDRHGCFVVRSAQHAMNIRQYVQRHNCRRAFVAGGGLLGLEAAFSLHRLGLEVTIGERSARPLRRQVDDRASELLCNFFESIGMSVRTGVEVAEVHGGRRVKSLTTTAGETVPTDLLVVAAGIEPTTALAANAGLDVNRGIVVDEFMRTSDPDVFAVGDVAEQRGQIWGLWAVAVAQAEAAGKNAVGGRHPHFATIPTTILKGAGIDLTSFGTVEPGPSDEVTIDVDTVEPWAYAKTVRRGGYVIGGVFINRTEQAIDAQREYGEFQQQATARIGNLY